MSAFCYCLSFAFSSHAVAMGVVILTNVVLSPTHSLATEIR